MAEVKRGEDKNVNYLLGDALLTEQRTLPGCQHISLRRQRQRRRRYPEKIKYQRKKENRTLERIAREQYEEEHDLLLFFTVDHGTAQQRYLHLHQKCAGIPVTLLYAGRPSRHG